jgi:exopolyphosphatase/guanosine-5'-triphosphate,3'-diphosphate pyrophosphatase
MEKFAVIELNSTNMKLMIAKRLGEHFFDVLDELVDYVEIGSEAAKELKEGYFVKPKAVTEIMTNLKGYKKLCASYGVSNVMVICKNAVRHAKNNQTIVSEINSIFGFEVKVLTEQEELNLLYSGVINSLDIGKALIVSINAHDTQFVLFSRRNIMLSTVVNYGAEHILEETKELKNQEKVLKYTKEKYLSMIAEFKELSNMDEEFKMIVSGFGAKALASVFMSQKKYPLDNAHGLELTSKELTFINTFLAGLEVDENKKLRGISPEKSTLIPVISAAALAIFEELNFQFLKIGLHDVMQGYLLNYFDKETTGKPITDVLSYTLEREFLKLRNAESNQNVYEIVILLFKQLKVVHKLPRFYQEPLKIASYLHDLGKQMSKQNYMKMNFNLILNCNLYGASHRELLIAAFMALCEDSINLTANELGKYREVLTAEDIDAIKKGGCLIRLAENLDRCNKNLIKDVSCDILGDGVILKVEVTGDAEFEIKEANNAKNDFLRAFKKNLELL